MSAAFDTQKHPRGASGRFAERAGYAGPAFSQARPMEGSPGPMRSMTRGEAWQRIGSKVAALPVQYTGSKQIERPVGSYLSLTLTNQIPKSVSVEDHQKRVARYIQLVKDSRKEIMEGAEKNRKGKKHIFLHSYEPASGGKDRWRMKPDLYPEGTSNATLNRAYNHAALVHMHERGLVDYDWKMDPDLQAELKPTEPFMRYALRRLAEKTAVAMPGEKKPYHDEFATPFPNPKFDKVTGGERKRFRPNQQLIKSAPAVMHPGCAVAIDKLRGGKLAKASPIAAAVRGAASRAGAALDRASAPEQSVHDAYQRIDSIATRARNIFTAKAPHTASQGSYTAGRWAAASGRKFVKNPAAAVKKGVIHSARIGSGFGQGVADEFGASPRTRKIAGRVGAVAGAVKIPVIAGAVAAKPVSMAYHELGFGNQPDKQQVQKMLDEALDLAKRAPAIARKLANSSQSNPA